MISSVLVLDQANGTVRFHRSYKTSDLKDIDLTAGLLTAIFQFAKEFGEEELNSMTLQNTKFVFSAANNLLFILQLANPNVPDAVSADYIKKIQSLFFVTFGNSWSDTIQNEHHRLAFSEQLDEVLEQRVEITEIPMLFSFNVDDLLLDLIHAPEDESIDVTVRELKGCFYRLFQDEINLELFEQLTNHGFIFYIRGCARFAVLIPFFLANSSELLIMGFTTPRENLYALHHLLPQVVSRARVIYNKIGSFYRIVFRNKPLIEVVPRILEENEDIKKEIQEWADLKKYVDNFALMLGEQLMKAGTIEEAMTEDRIRAEMSELIRVGGNDIDKLLFALLSHKKVVILGDREKVEPLVATILNFIPIPSFLLWSESPVPHALVGHPPNVDKKYLNDAVVVDLISRKIRNGQSNLFCKQLVEETVQIGRISSRDARLYLQTKLSALYIVISQLIDGFHDNRENIQKHVRHLYLHREEDEKRIMLEITKELNPLLAWTLELLENPRAKHQQFLKQLKAHLKAF